MRVLLSLAAIAVGMVYTGGTQTPFRAATILEDGYLKVNPTARIEMRSSTTQEAYLRWLNTGSGEYLQAVFDVSSATAPAVGILNITSTRAGIGTILSIDADTGEIYTTQEELYVDPVSNRVGINTGAPSASLHVNGTTLLGGASTFAGHFVPTVASTYDLGSAAFPIRAIYADSITGTFSLDPDDLIGDAVDNNLVDSTLLSDLDPDQLTGDTTDNNFIDLGMIGGGTTASQTPRATGGGWEATSALTVASGATGLVTVAGNLVVGGTFNLGDAGTDIGHINGFTTVEYGLNFPATGGPASSLGDSVPLFFGVAEDASEVGNGVPIFIDADDYNPSTNARTFIVNNWSDFGTTYFLIENTDSTYGAALMVEDRIIFGAENAQQPQIAMSSTAQSGSVLLEDNAGHKDFHVSNLTDRVLDLFTYNGSAGSGLRVNARTSATTAFGYLPDVMADGTLYAGWPGTEAFLVGPTYLGFDENPSGRVVLYGQEETGHVEETTYDGLGAAIELHGTGSTAEANQYPDWLLMAVTDGLALYESPANMNSPTVAESILRFDDSALEMAVSPAGAQQYDFSVGGTDLFVDVSANRVGINDSTPSEALDVTGNGIVTGEFHVRGVNLYLGSNSTFGDGVITFNPGEDDATLTWSNTGTGDGQFEFSQAVQVPSLTTLGTTWQDFGMPSGQIATLGGASVDANSIGTTSNDIDVCIPLDFMTGTVITQIRGLVKNGADDSTLHLERRAHTSLGWTDIGNGTMTDGTLLTVNVTDAIVAANYSYRLRAHLLGTGTDVQLYDMGVETNTRAH